MPFACLCTILLLHLCYVGTIKEIWPRFLGHFSSHADITCERLCDLLAYLKQAPTYHCFQTLFLVLCLSLFNSGFVKSRVQFVVESKFHRLSEHCN